MVGTGNTQTNEPSDAAISRVHGSPKGIAMTTDCNSRYVFADPYSGAMIAVSEAARNIVCSGGEPVGVTNCLNFGNPYNKEVYYQFVNAIKGMGEACTKLRTPVTGGNVSFYNQSSDDGPVYPTPTIGMVGILDDLSQKMTMYFKNDGDAIYVIGKNRNDINCSEYLHSVCGVTHSPAPHFDMEEEAQLQALVLKTVRAKLVNSAHDTAEGGLFVTLLESAMQKNMGFEIATDNSIRKDAFLFGEAQSRVVVSVSADKVAAFEAAMGNHPYSKIGTVKAGGNIKIDNADWGYIKDWKEAYDTAIEKLLNA
jgi:phosphoribosylformylglycinamidine synthase